METNKTAAEDRRSGRRSRVTLILGVIVTAVIAGGLAGVAGAGLGPAFSDVDEDHPFYEEIGWASGTNVAKGFTDGTYRPGQAVNRGSMAAFMQRLFDLQEDLAVGSSASAIVTTSSNFSVVPGTTVEIEVPPGTSAWIVARFSAESVCFGASDWCSVRLMIDDNGDGVYQEMAPAAGTNFSFDSSDSDTEGAGSWESHAMERWDTVSRGCTCKVRAEYQARGGTTFGLDDYTLVAETDLLPSNESFGP